MKFSLLLRKEVQNLGCLLGYVCLWGLYKCTQKEMKIVKDYMGIVKREHIEISPWIIIFVNIEPNSIRMQPKVYLQGLQDDENVFVWFRILVKIKHYVFVLISTSLQFVLRVYKMGSLQLHWLTFWNLTELTLFFFGAYHTTYCQSFVLQAPEYMPEDLTMYSAWVGGAILAKVVFPQNQHMTKADYDETGPSIVHRKCF